MSSELFILATIAAIKKSEQVLDREMMRVYLFAQSAKHGTLVPYEYIRAAHPHVVTNACNTLCILIASPIGQAYFASRQ